MQATAGVIAPQDLVVTSHGFNGKHLRFRAGVAATELQG